jgi:hypothetical protein
LGLDPSLLYISTARDLHEAVLVALEAVRPNAESQGVYWKDVHAGRPANEPDITQNLALLLEPRLGRMIVNAEVSCRGHRTDIQIEAVILSALGEPNRLRCVIEAKKCDNPGLAKGIGTQLVRKYLQSLRGDTGIYLVLWFCTRKKCNCVSRTITAQDLQIQAEQAPTPISVVHFEIRNRSRSASRQPPSR